MIKKRVWLFCIAILILTVFCCLLYFVWGGKFYFEARKSINRLPHDKKTIAEGFFDSKDDYFYSGMFMGSIKFWPKGVWVWGQSGPRYFRSDEYTVYSYFQMCTPENIQNLAKGRSIKPSRTVDTDIKLWVRKAKVGDFITIKPAGPKNGGNLGRLREAWAYDWWIFNSALPINRQCEK